MPRPKKVSTEIMGNEVVEVKKNYQEVQSEIENNMIQQDVLEPKIAKATFVEDKVPELTVEIVKPKVQEEKANLPTPICDIEALSESDKEVLIEKRIKAILDQTQIPYIPAVIRFKEPETTAIPPMYALVDFDHRFVDEGWKFYQTNVRNPYVKDYINLIAKLYQPNRIFPRLVIFNYE